MAFRCRICRNPIEKRVCTPFGTWNLCGFHADQWNPTLLDSGLWGANPPFDEDVRAWGKATARWGQHSDPIEELKNTYSPTYRCGLCGFKATVAWPELATGVIERPKPVCAKCGLGMAEVSS